MSSSSPESKNDTTKLFESLDKASSSSKMHIVNNNTKIDSLPRGKPINLKKTRIQRFKNWITPSFLKKNNKTNLQPETIIKPLQIKNFKNINQYIKKDFIYIDITNLLGETFIKSMNEEDNCFEKVPLLKTIAYSLTSNNQKDKARIIYFLKEANLYVYNTKEYKSYKKTIT